MAARDDVDAPLIAVLGFIGALLVFLLIIGLEVLFYSMERAERERKYIERAPTERSQLQAEQMARLTEYRYLDEKKGVVAIPIDRAMELVVDELPKPPGSGKGEDAGNEP
jgi:hypothetical protein